MAQPPAIAKESPRQTAPIRAASGIVAFSDAHERLEQPSDQVAWHQGVVGGGQADALAAAGYVWTVLDRLIALSEVAGAIDHTTILERALEHADQFRAIVGVARHCHAGCDPQQVAARPGLGIASDVGDPDAGRRPAPPALRGLEHVGWHANPVVRR